MIELMRPGESVAKSLRRLGGGQKVTSKCLSGNSSAICNSPGSESVPEMEEEEGRCSGRPQGEREQGADAEAHWYRR